VKVLATKGFSVEVSPSSPDVFILSAESAPRIEELLHPVLPHRIKGVDVIFHARCAFPRRDASAKEEPWPEIVHIYGINPHVFLTASTHTEELMSYLTAKGLAPPKTVVWVNDSSANVVFSDARAAAAALQQLTVPLFPNAQGIDTTSWRTLPIVEKGCQLLFRLATASDFRPKRGPCKNWDEIGRCLQGRACKFVHIEQEAEDGPPPAAPAAHEASLLVHWTYYRPDAEVLPLITPAAARARDETGWLPLHKAAEYSSSVAVVQALLAANPEAAKATNNRGGFTPLHYAARSSISVAVVQALLAANPEAAKATDKYGSTPLHLAAGNNSLVAVVAVVQMLLAANPETAKARTTNNGRLPLHVAARFSPSVAVVQALLAANPEAAKATDNAGSMPLHLAAWGSSSVAVVQVLLAAYPEAAKNKNDKGETPADLAATNNGNAEVKAFFASGQDVRQPRYKPPPYKPPPLRKQRSTSFPKGAHLQSPASDAHTDLDRRGSARVGPPRWSPSTASPSSASPRSCAAGAAGGGPSSASCSMWTNLHARP
jgi:hypothetical protein